MVSGGKKHSLRFLKKCWNEVKEAPTILIFLKVESGMVDKGVIKMNWRGSSTNNL